MNETTQQEKTTQLVSRNETTQLCTVVDRLQRLQPPTTACNRLQPPATACTAFTAESAFSTYLRRIHQTWILPITTYLHHWDTYWLTSASLLTKTSNLGLMTGWPQRPIIFFLVWYSQIARKMGEMCS
ncbi:hypothetical protein TNCV_468911 [Trichonephila clavipes]|nr:hypothetical protein TNCV_468911 [Trichonephila clavipes]